MEEGPGDILVFLTGQEEIEAVERLVNERLRQLPQGNQKLLVFPIFSSLPSEKQLKVFIPAPVGFRKVELSFVMFLLFSVSVLFNVRLCVCMHIYMRGISKYEIILIIL